MIRFGTFLAAILLCIFLAALPRASHAQTFRYDVKPVYAPPAAAAAKGTKAATALPQAGALLRFVEGIDGAARAFAAGEIERELGDPFGRQLAAWKGAVPADVGAVLAMLDASLAAGAPRPEQAVFVLSESGQIPVAAFPALTRRARAVVARSSGTNEVVFIAPSMRADGTLEVIAWDPGKQLMNYYARSFEQPGDRPVWFWKGDSSQAWRPETRDKACFVCHRNGEPVMKELRQPWQNWHSQSASIKPEAIPQGSPLETEPLFRIQPPSAFLKGGEMLEMKVNSWVGRVNQSRVAQFKAGRLDARNILEPLFRTTTANLVSSVEQSIGIRDVSIPWTFFVDTPALSDVAGLDCDTAGAFGAGEPRISRAQYAAVLAALEFRLQDGATVIGRPGDTHFAFFTPEVARTDRDLIFNLVSEGLIDQRFAATMLLVDVQNPVYSPVRAAMHALVPPWKAADVRAPALGERLAQVFRGARNATGLSAPAREGLAQFVELWDQPAGTWQAGYCKKVETYLRNVGEKWRSGAFEPYFRLLGARREQLLRSDHKALVEVELLFPKSKGDARDLMRFDGTVGPR